MRFALSRENPKSIMRRTAIGTSSVVTAATNSAMSAAIARDIGQKRQQRLEPAALLVLGGGHGGALRLANRRSDGARSVSLDDVHFNGPFGTRTAAEAARQCLVAWRVAIGRGPPLAAACFRCRAKL